MILGRFSKILDDFRFSGFLDFSVFFENIPVFDRFRLSRYDFRIPREILHILII